MDLSASDIYPLLRPVRCELRVFFRHKGMPEGPTSPYADVLLRLGERHEKTHLSSFPTVVDLGAGQMEERLARTRAEVERGAPVIYQGALASFATLAGVECRLLGVPDFLIRANGGYLVRDSKISRRITEEDHPEILRQLELYGWLYQKNFGAPPVRLEVHAGTGDLVVLPFDGGQATLAVLQEILALHRADAEPYSPVGWTKCGACGYRGRCWPRAEESRDVALVSGVDQGLATALRRNNILSVDDLLGAFDEKRLSDFQRPWGSKQQRVGKKAASILTMASVLASGKELLLETPQVPSSPNYVMFDLEGLPPQLDDLNKIYLWGTQVFGSDPSEYHAALAGFGTGGDRQGWEDFLTQAAALFERHGDIPFVHWATYERTFVRTYIERYGDSDGTGARVLQNLLDLLPVTQRAVALPLPSYSLKVVERYIGFERRQEEYGGDWSMAKYIEATESEDEAERAQVVQQIVDYNREDLEATWAVLTWLKAKVK